MNKKENGGVSVAQGLLALSPLLVFLLMYLVLSVILGDFYKVPLSVAFIVASLWGVATMRGVPLRRRIDVFSGGAANKDIIYMVWIFILAGAFAILAQKIGATEATVNLTFMAFNLIPIFPLDGFRVVETLAKPYNKYVEFNYRYGQLLLLGLIMLGWTLGRFNPYLDILGLYMNAVQNAMLKLFSLILGV